MKKSIAYTLLLVGGVVRAEEPRSTPLPTPITRPDVKVALEALKDRKPRIPLPELTAAERAQYGDREPGYEARLRALYLTEFGDGRGAYGLGREPGPNMTLDYAFKTEMFWIVSRINNCLY